MHIRPIPSHYFYPVHVLTVHKSGNTKHTYRITTKAILPPQVQHCTVGMSSRKKELLSLAMKRTTEWVSSQEVPTNVTVHVGGASYSLHKFPLVSKCGYIRKLLSQQADAIEIHDLPGGVEAFELATKYCYGVNFEINVHNVAMLRCVAEHLEMTEQYAVVNLVGRTEAYLSEVALKSLSGALSVLIASENLLPVAENVRLVRRCVDAVSYLVCKEAESCVDWWVKDLTRLKIEFFRRVLVAMMARGFKQSGLGPVLMLYAQKTIRGLDVFGKMKEKMDPREEQKKRLVLETIVSLLPKEKNALPATFLSTLLRSSMYLDTTVSCRLDLEKRMALQLDEAVLDDLLIVSHSSNGGTLFDVDTVKRIMMNYFDAKEDHVSSLKVGSLIENYLAEIASDKSLSASKFSGLVELIPKQSRVMEDGLYRAIDIFLKAHPNSSEIERKKLCSLMDCQKLSQEAPRATMPPRQRFQCLREAMASNGNEDPSNLPLALHLRTSNGPDESADLRRENEELKMEVLKIKMKMKEMERSTDHRLPLLRKSLIDSVSRKLGKLNPLARANGMAPSANARGKPRRDRRHSIS